MPYLTSIHWRAPTTIILAGVAGLGFILSHHLFYAGLDGRSVPHGDYNFAGRSLSKQQLNIFIGTTFAFLVKVFFCFAISIAYVQVIWRSMRNREQAPSLSELDWANSGLDNVLNVFDVGIARKFPFLFLLALIFWCIPISTIFPPATLSIAAVPGRPHAMLQVPQVDFTSLKFSDDLRFVTSAGVLNNYYWSGPSQQLQHLAFAVMGVGDILPITAPAQNSSWTLDSWAPSLRCVDVAGSERDATWINIWNYYATNGSASGSFAYLSWAPWSYNDYYLWYDNLTARGIDPNLPFLFDVPNGPQLMGPPTTAVSTDGIMSLFMAVLPAAQNFKTERISEDRFHVIFNDTIGCEGRRIDRLAETLNCTNTDKMLTPAMAFKESTLLRCDVVNSSSSLHLTFIDGKQGVNVTVDRVSEALPVRSSKWIMAPHPPGFPDEEATLNCASFQLDPRLENNGTACLFDITAVRSISYQSIMAAFSERVLGDIRNGDSFVAVNSTITQTMLGNTDELAFFRLWRPEALLNRGPNLQALLANRTQSEFTAIIAKSDLPSRGSLKSTLEDLFQNFTVSLLSEPFFWPDYSSPFAPQREVNVSLNSFSINYRYDALTLWLSYGVSIFATMFAMIAGLFAIALNGASFSNDFSTIVRIGRKAQMDVEIDDEDALGSDPLPRYLKHARFDTRSFHLPQNRHKSAASQAI